MKNILGITVISIITLTLCLAGCGSPSGDTADSGDSEAVAAGEAEAVDEYPGETDESVEVPYGTKIYEITDAGITYYWKMPEGVDGYEVYRSYEKSSGYEFLADIKSGTGGTYTDDTFDHDKKSVYYKIRSYVVNDDGTRSYSEFADPSHAKYRDEIKIQRSTTYLPSGYTRTIAAYYGWGNLQDAVWESSDPDVATISEDGTITAVSKGSCQITCSSESLQASVTSKVVVDRDAEDIPEEYTSRYVQSEETGIWENPDAEDTGDALIMMTGDMMCTGSQIREGKQDEGGHNFDASYAFVADLLSSSDFTIGNLETMLSSSWPYMSDEGYIDYKANCNAPSSYLGALRYAGFDAVVMSNNHNCDTGQNGITETLEQVERYDLGHTGLYANEDDCRYLLVDVNGIKVGYLSYMSEDTGFNGKDADWPQEDIDTMLNYFSKEKAKEDIQAVRAAGAEYVIVYMHWGVKNHGIVNKSQLRLAQELADAGADYIVGSHPHLIQEYDEITAEDGRVVPCFYSLGDFQSSVNQIPGNRDTVILRIRLSRNEAGEVELAENTYIPCYTYTNYKDHPYTVIPLDFGLSGGIKTKSTEKFYNRVVAAVGDKIQEYVGDEAAGM